PRPPDPQQRVPDLLEPHAARLRHHLRVASGDLLPRPGGDRDPPHAPRYVALRHRRHLHRGRRADAGARCRLAAPHGDAAPRALLAQHRRGVAGGTPGAGGGGGAERGLMLGGPSQSPSNPAGGPVSTHAPSSTSERTAARASPSKSGATSTTRCAARRSSVRTTATPSYDSKRNFT